jgi:hypothetical protein
MTQELCLSAGHILQNIIAVHYCALCPTRIPWPESASKLYWPSNGRFSPQLMPNFSDRGCRVVRAADPYSRILGFIDRLVSHYRMIIRSSHINSLVVLNRKVIALFCGRLCYRWHRSCSWSSSDGQSTSSSWNRAPLWGPWPDFTFFFFFRLTITLMFFPGPPLWIEDGSLSYTAIADWSGHWGPITIHYRLIWDCVPFFVSSYYSQGLRWKYSNPPSHGALSEYRTGL